MKYNILLSILLILGAMLLMGAEEGCTSCEGCDGCDGCEGCESCEMCSEENEEDEEESTYEAAPYQERT